MTRIIGIDLGTTNSLSATVFEEGPEVIGNSENAITPSVLSRVDSKWLVGQEAQEQRINNPENTVSSVKRLMGRSILEIGELIHQLPYKIVQSKRSLIKVRFDESKIFND